MTFSTFGVLLFTSLLTLSSLAGTQDTNIPTVTITAPANSFENPGPAANMFVYGNATDNVKIDHVSYRVNGSAWQTITDVTNTVVNSNTFVTGWQQNIQMTAGTNIFEAVSYDASGNHSTTNTRTFFYKVLSMLTVTTNGWGTVIGTPRSVPGDNRIVPTNGAMLRVGRSYTVLATANNYPTNIFTNWTGSVTSSPARLVFTMQPNMNLTANFVTNPFVAAAGNYNGLFFATDGSGYPEIQATNSGFIELTLTSRLQFAGKIWNEGVLSALQGTFNLDGTQDVIVGRQREGRSNLSVHLKVQFGSGQILGSVSAYDPTTQAVMWDPVPLQAVQESFGQTNPATNYMGTYNMLIPPQGDWPIQTPAGYGWVTMNISANGTIRAIGTAGDGTPISPVGSLGMNIYGMIPFFAQMYGTGVMTGWLSIANNHSASPAGELTWIKPTISTDRFYPNGFTNVCTVMGSSYTNPGPNGLILNVLTGNLAINGGNMNTRGAGYPSALFYDIAISSTNSAVTRTGGATNRLTVTWSPTDGEARITFLNDQTNPQSPSNTTARGVVLQQQMVAAGVFPGTNQSGQFLLFGPNSNIRPQ